MGKIHGIFRLLDFREMEKKTSTGCMHCVVQITVRRGVLTTCTKTPGSKLSVDHRVTDKTVSERMWREDVQLM